jgi:hypothetical protein
MKLLTTTIRELTAAPAAFDKVHFDERLPGFGLRVRASGAHSWMIKYAFGGRVRRMVLGPLSALDPGKAFDTAKDLLAQVRARPPKRLKRMLRPPKPSARFCRGSWNGSALGRSLGATWRPSATFSSTPSRCTDSTWPV